jgi:hypothetical protein
VAHGPRRRQPDVVGDVVQSPELVVVAPPSPVRQRAEVPEHVFLCGHRSPCRHPIIDSSGHAVPGTAGKVSRRWIEDRADWSIRRLARTARRYRTIETQASNHTITTADPLPDDLHTAVAAITQDAH